MEPDVWEALLEEWRTEIGPWSTMAIYQRSQHDRSGVAILLRDQSRRSLAFVKLQPASHSGLRVEASALRHLKAFGPRSFHAPELLREGGLSGWRYVAMSSLPPVLHRPPRAPDLSEITAEIQSALVGLPVPSGLPSHWRPLHGDFTPWNLREIPKLGLSLVDWEGASWGPPSADQLLYSVCEALVLGTPLPRSLACDEAAHFWFERFPAGSGGASRDATLRAGIRAALSARL